MPKLYNIFIPLQNEFVIVHVCFVLFIVCLYICVCKCLLQNNNHTTKHKNNTNSGSAFEPGASGLPYYCTSICVRLGCTRLASCVDSKTVFLFSFFQFSLEAQSPQLPSKEDTSSVGKGGGQQRWHSDATLESTVPGTRLIVTSCPPVTSCCWRDKSSPSLTSACRYFGHDEIIRPKGDDQCPNGRTRVVGEKGSGYRLPHWEAGKGLAS